MNHLDTTNLLNGKIAIVTGASKGIGKCIVQLFASQGAIVYANARTKNSIDVWVGEANKLCSGKIISQYYDVTDTQAVKSAIIQIKKEQGKIDILVNNAAVTSNELLTSITKSTMKNVFDTNVFSMIEMIQYVSKFMIRQESGSIINISSIVAQRGNKGQITYSASKGAVISLTQSVAKELAEYGIRVNAIAPGLVDTDAMRGVDEQYLQKRISNILMGRVAQPLDIANTALFLASNLSEYLSGEVIGVNGCTEM